MIEIKPRQFLVKEGDTIIVNKLDLKPKQILNITDVLLTHDGKKTKIGQPFVKNASVKLLHLETKKGKKIRVGKFKAKSRYRRIKGHRQIETYLQVKSIKIE